METDDQIMRIEARVGEVENGTTIAAMVSTLETTVDGKSPAERLGQVLNVQIRSELRMRLTEKLFNQTEYTSLVASASTTNADSSITSQSSVLPADSAATVAAIASGVVVGCCCLLLIFWIAVYRRARKRRGNPLFSTRASINPLATRHHQPQSRNATSSPDSIELVDLGQAVAELQSAAAGIPAEFGSTRNGSNTNETNSVETGRGGAGVPDFTSSARLRSFLPSRSRISTALSGWRRERRVRSAANPPNAGHRGFRSGDEHATAGSRSSPTASGTTVNRLAANAVPTSPRSSRIKKETLYQIGDIVYGRKADGGMWLAQLKSQVVRTTDLTKRQNKVTYNDERPKVRFFVPTGIASSGSSSAAYSYARDGAQRASTILGSLRVTVLNTDSTTSRNEVVSFAVTHGELTTARRHIIFGESNVVPPARPFVPAADTRGVATGQPHNYPGSLPAVVPGHVVADSSTVTADEASLQHLSEEEQIAMALSLSMLDSAQPSTGNCEDSSHGVAAVRI